MTALKVIDAGSTNRTITQVKVIDPAGTDRLITSIRVIDATGTDRLVYSSAGGGSFAVSVTPTSIAANDHGTGHATTGSVTASATGGTAPYTYSWALTSYDSASPPTANQPTSANTTFSLSNIGYNEVDTAVFTVTAKDSTSPTPQTATAQVNVTFKDLSGGGTL